MKLAWSLLFQLFGLALAGQTSLSLGLLPELTFGHRFHDRWKLSFQVEAMQRTHQGAALQELDFGYDYVRTDLTTVISRKVSPLSSVATGYMYRLSGEDIVHRALQQYAWTRRQNAWRIGQRLRLDQTWRDGRSPVYRARYRVSIDIPLEGQTLDERELYFIPSAEQLGILSSGTGEGESRLLFRIGYLMAGGIKLETGIDHRYTGYVQGAEQHQSWWMFNAFIDI